VVAIIDSMTRGERDNHMIINGAGAAHCAGQRHQRAGSQPVLKQYAQARNDDEGFPAGIFDGKKLVR